MSGVTIYKREYPRVDAVEELRRINEETLEEMPRKYPTFDEFYRKMEEATAYILIPERVESAVEFVKTAIEVSELYDLDTEIVRHDYFISVTYSFDSCGGMRDIRRVFGMADEFSFFGNINGWEFTICMDYYTHAVVRNGRIVAPDLDWPSG